MGARHTDSILNGAIQKVDVVTRGSGYAKEPVSYTHLTLPTILLV